LEALNAAPPIRRILAPPSVTCETSKLQIRFASPEIAGAVGLEYARVERREIAKTIKRNAEIRFDENRLAHLASRAPGVVVSVEKDLGDRVSAGETLAVVDSAELGSTKADYLRAAAFVNLWEKNSAREGRLLAGGVGTERDALEAETSLIESRVALAGAAQRLRNLGISDERIERLAETGEADSRLELTAPFDGVVIERSATAGEVVDAARPLFTVGDPSRVWAIVDVYEDDAPQLSAGRPVIFANAGLAGDARGGFITWVSPRVDPRTRTIKVRAEIDNPDGRLRAGMFGEAEIVVHDREAKSLAPKEAVQWEGCCNVVFVRRSDTLFEPRKVWIGYETDRHVAIESGLDGDEEIVTTGSFLLKTELLKGSIGAGCCEVAPGK
jgi:cobalt-zinc-cadmium efflux system membrane fusion protein